MVIDEKGFSTPRNKPIEYNIEDNGCWISSSHTSTYGYRPIRRRELSSKQIYLHRYIYFLYKGTIPDGRVVMHTCDNPRCINPEHLVMGTQRDNMRDKASKGRSGYVKLTNKQIIEIFYDRRTQEEICKEYGVTQGYISRIKNKGIRKLITRDL